ncbi:hypothetical protein EGW08_021162 [Elysia chlorotica]|uniref:Resistance to inhibitors of cholinesterase protein 3 N-terminal domain-containing protein n=1 Tax=Elysia chlorotica TaxID=188477 RepID=A0A3S0ZMT8_ELYCH|nr:hypothetical protein EGW08_021162 [Elysia chlorotica]
MADVKFIGTVAIMVACFAVIYPRFMHPFFLKVFGFNDPPKHDREGTHPPGFNNPNHPQQKKGVDDVRRHMRAGPHPGMRAAAEMQKQQAQQGSGRGMMGVVLPMYAIGIVMYLVYTLFKVFNKSKGGNDNESSVYRNHKDQRGHQGRRNMSYDRMGFPMDYQGNDDVQSFLSDHQRRQELEELLNKVDDKNVSTEEMRVLQRRLEETEAQMSRILQAMQSVQTNVDRIVPQPGEQAEEFDQDQPRSTEEEENAEADQDTVPNEDVGEGNPSSISSQVPSHDKDDGEGKDEINKPVEENSDCSKTGKNVGNLAEEFHEDDNEKEDEKDEDIPETLESKDQESSVRLRKVKAESEQ